MSGVPRQPLASDAAHLWRVDCGAFAEPSITERWLACLEEHEVKRYGALRESNARREYLGTRALSRIALAHYTGQAPECLRFGKDQGERPRLVSPEAPGLAFSLARTRGLAVGLFACGPAVGVDVECVAPIDAVELAERFFSAEELAELVALEGDARLARFYTLWTLREAYLKARGVGLTLPLDQLTFRLRAEGVEAEFGPAIDDDPARWQLRSMWLTECHLAATCMARRSSDPALQISHFEVQAKEHAGMARPV